MSAFFEIGYGKNGAKMGAEYRFVPTAPKVEPAPLCRPGKGGKEIAEISHLRPVPGGFSGTLTVRLKSMDGRPFLFGMKRNCALGPENMRHEVTVPAKAPFDGTHDYVIPGKAARGMIKAVFRIATASGLEPINKHHHFAERSFEYRKLRDLEGQKAEKGWMIPTRREGPLAEGPARYDWVIKPAEETNRAYLSHEDLAKLVMEAEADRQSQRPDVRFWREMKNQLNSRRGKLAEVKQNELEELIGCGNFLVVTGPMKGKKGEAVFGPPVPSSDEELPLSGERAGGDQLIELFLQANSEYKKWGSVFPGGARCSVSGNLRFFMLDYAKFLETQGWADEAKALLENHGVDPKDIKKIALEDGYPGIPVYYLQDKDTGTLYFGTAEVFKTPHIYGVKDLHERRPVHTNDFDRTRFTDWTEALFGTIDAWREEPGDKQAQMRLAGRVRFGFARLKEGNPEPEDERVVLQGAPKASFQAHYLTETQPGSERPPPQSLKGSWSSPTTVLAGHKRYPAVRPYPGPVGEKFRGRLKKTEALVKPLKGEATFELEIRFDNLHPLELGGLLWSVSFGDREVFRAGGDTRYRHVGGRLRHKGLGRFQPREATLKLRQNPMPPGYRLTDFSDRPEERIDALLLAFETEMGGRFRCQYDYAAIPDGLEGAEAFYAAPPIEALLNMSDARWGMDAQGNAQDPAALKARFALPKMNGKTDFTPFMQLSKALYEKREYRFRDKPARSAFSDEPIQHLLDDFFGPVAETPEAAPPQDESALRAFHALRDPLGAIRAWRAKQPTS